MANARRRTQRPTRSGTRSVTSAAAIASTLEGEEGRLGRTVDWQNELKYINKDLRDLMVISILLFVLLFAVGFLL